MGPAPAFDLRQVRLAQTLTELPLEGGGEFLLRHLAIHAAQSAFHEAQVAKFFAEFHIAVSNYSIAICNVKKWISMALNRLHA
jgi:hypothetical protein